MSRSTKTILTVFFVMCALILVIDPFVPREHHYFKWETWPGFYGVYGFVSCVVLVFIAKYGLRPLVMREEEDEDK